MKKIMLVIVISTLVQLTTARAGQNGDGGAIVCMENNCMTLSEAGFRVANSNPALTEITPEVVLAIASFDKEYDVEIIRPDFVIGNRGDITFLKEVDKKKVSAFTKKYKDILLAQGEKELADKFTLGGFTAPNEQGVMKSYILLDRYNSLTTLRSKVLLLTHEAWLRNKEKSLIDVLKWEGAVLDYLSAKTNDKLSQFDFIKFYQDIRKSNIALDYIIGKAIYDNNMVCIEDLFPFDSTPRPTYYNHKHKRVLSLTYAQILGLQQFHQSAPSLVENGIFIKTLSLYDFFQDYLYYQYGLSHAGTLLVTDGVFKMDPKIIKARLRHWIRNSWFPAHAHGKTDQEVIDDLVLKTASCTNDKVLGKQQQNELFSYPSRDIGQRTPFLLECNLSYIEGDLYPLVQMLWSFKDYLNGFGISTSLQCDFKTFSCKPIN